MSLKLRLILLVSLLVGLFVVAVSIFETVTGSEVENSYADLKGEKERALEYSVNLVSEPLRQFAQDHAMRRSVGNLFSSANPSLNEPRLESFLQGSDYCALWAVDVEGHLVAGANRLAPALPDSGLPVAGDNLAAVFKSSALPHFFAHTSYGLIEILGVPVSERQDLRVRGWLLAARLWDGRTLKTLSDTVGVRVDLRGPAEPVLSSEVGVRLLDWQDRTLHLLVASFRSPGVLELERVERIQRFLFTAFGVLLVLGLAWGLQHWVISPLEAVAQSLSTSDPAPLVPLKDNDTELGRIATLVQTTFRQKKELQKEVEERKRVEAALRHSEAVLQEALDERASLGRNLHDGVIQSLYAAGMGLSGVKVLLRSNPQEAELRLEQTRAALNETIRDVRNFITGLEPEALRKQTFTQAVEKLVERLRALSPLVASLDVEEATAKKLSLVQRAHALQIIREAVSNSLRHGKASVVAITLRQTDKAVELVVSDNGTGFRSDSQKQGGKGLANLAERASELGAVLTVTSELGKGTDVCLSFTLPVT